MSKGENENCWKNMVVKVKNRMKNIFEEYTGHSAKCLESVNGFIELMYKPTDAASLGVGRMLFGLMMLIDIPDERGGGDLDLRWGEPTDCHFPLIHHLMPLRFSLMTITYFIMWLGALGITLGYRYRVSCLLFTVPYWYIFLLDKSVWNNHSYLYGLLGILFSVTEAQRYCSLDAIKDELTPTVPFWNYFIVKFQFFLLYFYAGIKKISVEWLSGYSMTNLGYHWVFTPFRLTIGTEMTEFLVVHWFTCFFDLTIAFFLVYKGIRLWATPFCVMFHLMNSRLFRIGMFPWTCLVELPLFYSVSWPRIFTKQLLISQKPDKSPRKFENEDKCDNCLSLKVKQIQRKRKQAIILMVFYACLQLFLPFSHFITKGYNSWTDGIYGYSWDMMVHAWDTVLVSVKIVDNSNGNIHYMQPYAYTESDRWTKHPDMARQYAFCINKNLQKTSKNGKHSQNISIYFDIWTSMNQRFQQRYFNPNVDLLTANWHPFRHTEWVLPIIDEFSALRPQMNKITKDVLSWNNSTDVIFSADFPGFSMDHYIPEDLDNVTLTVLAGTVHHQIEDGDVSVVGKGQSLIILPEAFHTLHVGGSRPASYMFTYLNKTLHLSKNIDEKSEKQVGKTILPIWDEFLERVKGYKRFFIHIGNAFLHELYDVPMPRRLRLIKD